MVRYRRREAGALVVDPGVQWAPIGPREDELVFLPQLPGSSPHPLLPFLVIEQEGMKTGGIGTALRLFFVLGQVKTSPPLRCRTTSAGSMRWLRRSPVSCHGQAPHHKKPARGLGPGLFLSSEQWNDPI